MKKQFCKSSSANKKGLTAMIGSGEHCKIFSSVQQVDEFITNMRNASK